MADIVGGPSDEVLNGTESADTIHGNGGNDQIDGKGGNDLLYGDDGDDIVRGGIGNDQLWGGAGINTLEGGDGNDHLGIDSFFAIAAGNIFDGGAGYDTLEPLEGVDISAATLISIEEIRIIGGPILMTVAQMNGVSALHAMDSTLDVAGFTLTNGGSVSLSGKSVYETSFILSNAGNLLDLTGAIIGDVLERNGFTISGRDGADTIIAAGGNDDIVGGAGNDVIDGAGGNDMVRGGAGRDTVSGGAGNDSLFIDAVPDFVAGEVYDGGAGVDAIYLPNGNFDLATLGVTITGIEEITLGAGVLSMTAAQLDQFSTFGAGTYVLTSGGNVSLAGGKLLADARFILSDLGNGFDLGGVVSGRGEVTGGSGADSIVGSAFNDILSGGGGDDVIQGGNGNDQLSGGAGNDKLYGGAGDDTYYLGSAADLVFENAGAGVDLVSIENNFYLFANIENLSLAGSGNYFGVGNDLANMMFGNGGENLLIAGNGDDIVRGGEARDAIFGEQGADQLFGDGGVDYMVGGTGNDILAGGKDADEIYGGDGDDSIYGGNNGGAFADADFSTDILVGGAGDDFINGGESFYRDGYGLGDYDRMYGNEGNDRYVVDTPNDLVFEQANEGIDTVYANINGAGYYLYDNIEGLVLEGDTPFGVGNALANLMTGSGSANYLLGGAGNDSLNGMGGNDVLFGEAGNDVFVFTQGSGADVIGDFTRGQDRIDLSALGISSLSQISGRFVQDGNVGAIQLATGDVIVLHNVQMNQLTAGDFIFGSATKEVGVADKVMAEGSSPSVDFRAPLTDGEWHGGALWAPQDYSLPPLFA